MLKYVSAAAVAFAMLTAPMSIPAFAEPKKEKSEAQKAAAEHQKQCSKEWQDSKAAGKVVKGKLDGLTWPKFNGTCMKRLSGTT